MSWSRTQGPVALPSKLFLVLLSLSATLLAQLEGTVGTNPDIAAGTDGRGRVLLFAPSEVRLGSSISHFDRSASPNLLMEPNISSDLRPLDVDITAGAFRDLGWTTQGGAQLVAQYTDQQGQGFFDPNLGAQRRAAFERALQVWAGVVSSAVTIEVEAGFDSLTCSQTGGATLAQASTVFAFQIGGTPFPATWYHGALAEALTGQDLSAGGSNPNRGDIAVTFNSQIDQQCLGNGVRYSYDLSGNAPAGEISFIATSLHEIGHGLGFANFVNEETGEFFQGLPDIYSQFTRDNVLRRTWANMGPAQIRQSAVRTGEVAWDGNQANRQAARLLDDQPVVRIDAPSAAAQEFPGATASFGPSVQDVMASAAFAVARPRLACTGLNNPGALSGTITIVERGECTFVEKVLAAQQAGARAVVVVNNVAGPAVPMGGDSDDVTIPSLMISDVDGATLIDLTLDPPPPDDDPPDDPPDDDPPDEPPSVCVPTPTQLCLQGGRFRVEMLFGLAAGANLAPADANLLTDDTGYFTFLEPANVEVVVKVLFGCPVTDHFWVFAGGLTDREIELKVVDTEVGRVRIYRNTLGSPLQPIQDTAAFDTCGGAP